MYKVDNAIIMAAGTSSRFAPLSYELPKALVEVKGEILIERQIKQLQEAGIKEIIVVVGYKKEAFNYLQDKYNVILVENPEYLTRNNNATIYYARVYLKNTYICSSDNYFYDNPFETEIEDSYYAALYAEGETKEWCMHENALGYIDKVTVGGANSWYMHGHAFWSQEFSKSFKNILEDEYADQATRDKYWEDIFMEHMSELPMKIKKYEQKFIFEFDSLEELRDFDNSYVSNTRSRILKEICQNLGCAECSIKDITVIKGADAAAIGFSFHYNGVKYKYLYEEQNLREDKQ